MKAIFLQKTDQQKTPGLKPSTALACYETGNRSGLVLENRVVESNKSFHRRNANFRRQQLSMQIRGQNLQLLERLQNQKSQYNFELESTGSGHTGRYGRARKGGRGGSEKEHSGIRILANKIDPKAQIDKLANSVLRTPRYLNHHENSTNFQEKLRKQYYEAPISNRCPNHSESALVLPSLNTKISNYGAVSLSDMRKKMPKMNSYSYQMGQPRGSQLNITQERFGQLSGRVGQKRSSQEKNKARGSESCGFEKKGGRFDPKTNKIMLKRLQIHA